MSRCVYDVIDRHGGGGSLTMGEDCRISAGVSIDVTSNVTLGNRVSISDDVMIFTHEHDVDNPRDRSKLVTSPLIIRDDVYIGARTIIVNSVNLIGENAFIGAGSVVTRDVSANSVVAGNPARWLRQKHERIPVGDK